MLASSGERKIHNILETNNVSFAEEFSFAELHTASGRYLRFDFAVFNKSNQLLFLIEFNGKQHYVPVKKFGGKSGLNRQKYNDNRKVMFCRNHRIPLVIIPYWEEQNITFDYILEKAHIARKEVLC